MIGCGVTDNHMQRVQGKTIKSPVGIAHGRLGQKRFCPVLLFKATRLALGGRP